MAYSGKYKVKNPKKYKGDFNNVVYRSSWERVFMNYCDMNEGVIEWNSEEVIIPYKSPLDGRIHRYFTDFWMKVLTKDGEHKEYIIEVKPYKETLEPVQPKRKTRKYVVEVMKYCKNRAKWDAAEQYCEKKGATFKILTEYDLNFSKKKRTKEKRLIRNANSI